MKYEILYVVYQAYLRKLCSVRAHNNINYFFLLFIFFPVSGSAIPLPSSQQIITPYQAVTTTKVGSDVITSKPIAVSAAATESGNVHLQVRTGTLDAPMDAYFGIVAQPIVPNTLLILAADGSLAPQEGELKPWKSSINRIDEAVFDGIALGDLPVGDYTFYLLLVPAGSSNPLQDNYYLWSSTMVLTVAKDLPPLESEIILDKSTVLMGGSISINHTSIHVGTPITVTYDDGSGFNVAATITPTIEGKVSVNTPPLITEEAPFLRSGSVNVTLEGVNEIASFFIVAPPELSETIPGEIASKVLQFSLDKLQATLDIISTMNSDEQATMEVAVSALQTQKAIILEQITQVSNQQVFVEMGGDEVTLGVDELAMIDRLILMHILSISEQYTAEQSEDVRAITSTSRSLDLDELKRNLAEIKENANGLAENTLNAIKNVGIPGTRVLVNGMTVGLGIVAITTSSVPIGLAATGTAIFAVVIQTTGEFTTTLVLQPSIDAVNGRVADLGQAANDALNVLADGFHSISLSFLGASNLPVAGLASLRGLARDVSAGYEATVELICNTNPNQLFCESIAPPAQQTVSVSILATSSTGVGRWFDTGIDIENGSSLSISASGKWRLGSGDRESDANGLSNFPEFQGYLFGTLLGRIGGNGDAFRVGTEFSGFANSSGRLFLGNNDQNFEDNSGSIEVSINVN